MEALVGAMKFLFPLPGLFSAVRAAVAFVSGVQESYADACLQPPTGGERMK